MIGLSLNLLYKGAKIMQTITNPPIMTGTQNILKMYGTYWFIIVVQKKLSPRWLPQKTMYTLSLFYKQQRFWATSLELKRLLILVASIPKI